MTVDPILWWGLIAFVCLLALSAFFSSCETAIFSLTRAQIDELADRKEHSAARLRRLMDEPRRLLIVLLTGNTVVNIIAATIAAIVTGHLFGGHEEAKVWGFVLQVIVVTLVILAFGEVLPKLAAVRNPLKWALQAAAPLTALSWFLTPVVMVFLPMTDFIARKLGVERRRLWISEEEIKSLVEVGEEHGALEKSEKELIHSIFEFGDTTVREIMIPRTDMVCLDSEAPADKLLEMIRDNQHTRIPVYEGSIDNIIGILHTKDLLLQYPFQEPFHLRTILRKPIFVPETKLISELLKTFQDERLHMTIAVDEYGGTAGLVTLEDVIEEIVGEIQDEHDAERPLWHKVDDHTFVADASLDVETVNQVLEADVIPVDQDYETLGGFLLSELGVLPEAKTTVEFHNYQFIVEEVRARRLGKVRIIRREISPENEP